MRWDAWLRATATNEISDIAGVRSGSLAAVECKYASFDLFSFPNSQNLAFDLRQFGLIVVANSSRIPHGRTVVEFEPKYAHQIPILSTAMLGARYRSRE